MRLKTGVNILVALGLGGAVAAGAAFAQGQQDRGGMMGGHMMQHFEQADADGDGKVTLDEMKAHRAERFAAMDGNGDGVLSQEEIVAGMKAQAEERMARRAARMIEMFDADGDGMVASDEMGRVDRAEMMFNHMDRDGDGAISAEERQSGMGMGHGRKGDRHRMHDGHDHGEHRGDGHGRHQRGHE